MYLINIVTKYIKIQLYGSMNANEIPTGSWFIVKELHLSRGLRLLLRRSQNLLGEHRKKNLGEVVDPIGFPWVKILFLIYEYVYIYTYIIIYDLFRKICAIKLFLWIVCNLNGNGQYQLVIVPHFRIFSGPKLEDHHPREGVVGSLLHPHPPSCMVVKLSITFMFSEIPQLKTILIYWFSMWFPIFVH